MFDDQLGHGVVLASELRKRYGIALLKAFQHGVVAHQLAEIDVVAFVNGSKRGGDDDLDARPSLTLCSRLSTGTRSLALARNDDFEVSVFEGVFSEHAQTVVHQSSVCIFGNFRRVVVKAHPSGRHDIGVDVIEQVLNGQIFHSEVEAIVELLLDEVQILGQEEDPLSGCQGNVFCRSLVAHVPPSSLFRRHPFITGSGHRFCGFNRRNGLEKPPTAGQLMPICFLKFEALLLSTSL